MSFIELTEKLQSIKLALDKQFISRATWKHET